jgi:hypothetical protein
MRTRSTSTSFGPLAALCVLLLGFAAGPARADITVALTTASADVAPGTDLDVFIDIPDSASAFNAFSMVLSYDPTALTLLPMAPTTKQQGCLMTGGCSDACGETFHQFSAAADSINVGDVVLCNQVSLTGPGRLYRLRFHAANRTVITYVTIRRARFFDAGLLVPTVNTVNLGLAIGAVTGVGDGGRPALHALRVEPNPAPGHVQFVTGDDREGWVNAEVLDLQGRVVRRLGPLLLAAGGRFAWDRADEHGVPVSAGVYLVRVHRGGQTDLARFVLLQ